LVSKTTKPANRMIAGFFDFGRYRMIELSAANT